MTYMPSLWTERTHDPIAIVRTRKDFCKQLVSKHLFDAYKRVSLCGNKIKFALVLCMSEYGSFLYYQLQNAKLCHSY